MTTRQSTQGYWTLEEACRELRCSRWTIMRWLRDKKLPGYQVGRRWLIPIQEVKEMLAKGFHPAQIEDRIVTEPALRQTWLRPITEQEAPEIAESVAVALRAGGAPVSVEGLHKLVRGEEHPDPMFWRYLVAGILKLQEEVDAVKATSKRQNPNIVRRSRGSGPRH